EEGLLRALEVTPPVADTTELDQRPAELAAQVGTQLLARTEDLHLRLGAGAAEPQDLRAVDATAPVQAADGAHLGPALHGPGPLLRQIVLRERLQRAHDLAVDHPGRHRIDLAREHRDAGLVEGLEPVADLAAD